MLVSSFEVALDAPLLDEGAGGSDFAEVFSFVANGKGGGGGAVLPTASTVAAAVYDRKRGLASRRPASARRGNILRSKPARREESCRGSANRRDQSHAWDYSSSKKNSTTSFSEPCSPRSTPFLFTVSIYSNLPNDGS